LEAASSATVQDDGSYNLTVLPGPGVVLVAASPRDSYACARIDEQELANLFRGRDSTQRRETLRRLREGQLANLSLDGVDRGGSSWLLIGYSWGTRCVDRYNALGLIHPDEEMKSLTLDVIVQRARPLRGTVIGPDGKPLSGVAVCGLTSMPDAERLEGASFLVEGLNPRRTRELSFHHKEKGLGKFLTIRGDETKTLTVRLEPCGGVLGRVIDKSGRPVPGVEIQFNSEGNGLRVRVKTDRQGRFGADLVPGLPYRMGTFSRLQKPVEVLTVESGRSKNFGDLILVK
jgi:hypothetical protein